MTVDPAASAASTRANAPAAGGSSAAVARMRVLVAEPIAPEGVEALRAAGHEVVVQTGLQSDELRAVIGDMDALIVRSQVRRTEIPLVVLARHRGADRTGDR